MVQALYRLAFVCFHVYGQKERNKKKKNEKKKKLDHSSFRKQDQEENNNLFYRTKLTLLGTQSGCMELLPENQAIEPKFPNILKWQLQT